MTAEQPTPKGLKLTAKERADKVKQLLVKRGAPPLEEGDEIRKLSSNATLAVIITTDDMFRACNFTETPTWEQYAVICGTIACLADSATQFTGLPAEGVAYMVADSIHFLFSGPDRTRWPKTESTYNFAVAQYRHMIDKPELTVRVDAMGRAFYSYLAEGAVADMDAMKAQFKALIDKPDVPDAIKRGPQQQEQQ